MKELEVFSVQLRVLCVWPMKCRAEILYHIGLRFPFHRARVTWALGTRLCALTIVGTVLRQTFFDGVLIHVTKPETAFYLTAREDNDKLES